MWKRVPGSDGGKGTKGPWYGGKGRYGEKGPWYGEKARGQRVPGMGSGGMVGREVWEEGEEGSLKNNHLTRH